MALSINTWRYVWNEKSKHLNQDSEIVAAVNNWLSELERIQDEDDRIKEEKEREEAERDSQEYAYEFDDIPF